MQKFYGFDSTIGVGRNLGFKVGEVTVLPPLEKPVITSIGEDADMAGLRIEFAQFGDFDSFSIYRSDTPMNVSSLPAPIATGLATMYYIDDTVVEGLTYYYRVNVARGADNQLSDEVQFTVPSDAPATGHKWWRLTNIATRTGTSFLIVADIRFNDIESYDSSKAFSNSTSTGGTTANNAFDGYPATWAQANNNLDGLNWIIGYEFNEDILVSTVSLRMYHNTQPNFGTEWQTADVEFSDDGLTWVKYGVIEPRIAQMDLSLITTPVIPL